MIKAEDDLSPTRSRTLTAPVALRASAFGEAAAFGRWGHVQPKPRVPVAYLLPERPRVDVHGNLVQRSLSTPARCGGCEQLVTRAPCLACFVRGR